MAVAKTSTKQKTQLHNSWTSPGAGGQTSMGSAVLFFCALKENTVQQTQETKTSRTQKTKKTIAHPKEDEKRATDLSSDI